MPVLSIDDSLDKIRGRFVRCRRNMTIPEVAADMRRLDIAIHTNTLYRFLRGQDLQLGLLRSIETWCANHEAGNNEREETRGRQSPKAMNTSKLLLHKE